MINNLNCNYENSMRSVVKALFIFYATNYRGLFMSDFQDFNRISFILWYRLHFVVVMTKLYKIKENNFKSISYFVDCLMT